MACSIHKAGWVPLNPALLFDCTRSPTSLLGGCCSSRGVATADWTIGAHEKRMLTPMAKQAIPTHGLNRSPAISSSIAG
jgi:hypothetical protein